MIHDAFTGYLYAFLPLLGVPDHGMKFGTNISP